MWHLPLLLLVASASAQIPSLGWCPDYQPMVNFNMKAFLGTWYEAERYFTISELGSRCVTTKYEATPEGRILVSNEITNALTGYKRVMEGTMQMVGREGEGRIIMKFQSVPAPYDNEYSILDTDYDNYAVMWSCSGIGPVHIQNAWIMTRERLAPSLIMQSAYAALEKYRISRTFFVKTDQADCTVLPEPAAIPVVRDAVEIELVVDAKSAPVVRDEEKAVPEKVVPAEKSAVPVVKSDNLVVERSANPELPEEAKPVNVIEEKKGEIVEKPEEIKDKEPMEIAKPAL